MEPKFLKSFAVILFISCTIGALIGKPGYHRYNYPSRGTYNFSRQLETAHRLESDTDAEWSIDKMNAFANNFHRLPQDDRIRSFIYTADVPEIGAEYLIVNWRASEPYYAKFYKQQIDQTNDYWHHKIFSLMGSLNAEEESR